MSEVTSIIIMGQTPAKKNNKEIVINSRTGKPFIKSSDRFDNWEQAALMQLRRFRKKFKGRVEIEYMFYVNDDTQRDIDNMMASINDVLQIANADMKLIRGKARPVKGTGIIQGDNWQLLRIGSADAAIDRKAPRAELRVRTIGESNGG